MLKLTSNYKQLFPLLIKGTIKKRPGLAPCNCYEVFVFHGMGQNPNVMATETALQKLKKTVDVETDRIVEWLILEEVPVLS